MQTDQTIAGSDTNDARFRDDLAARLDQSGNHLGARPEFKGHNLGRTALLTTGIGLSVAGTASIFFSLVPGMPLLPVGILMVAWGAWARPK